MNREGCYLLLAISAEFSKFHLSVDYFAEVVFLIARADGYKIISTGIIVKFNPR